MENELIKKWVTCYGWSANLEVGLGAGLGAGGGTSKGTNEFNVFSDAFRGDLADGTRGGEGWDAVRDKILDAGNGEGYGESQGTGLDDGSGWGLGNGFPNCVKIIKLKGYDVFIVDSIPTIITHIKNNYAKGFIVGNDYQLTPCYIVKDEYTNLFAHGKTLKEAVASLQEKVYKDMSKEERIKAFTDKFKPNNAYKGTEYFKWHNILTGSCLMGREQFVKDNDLDLNATYTVLQFIKIVENAYGGQIIKELKQYYANNTKQSL